MADNKISKHETHDTDFIEISYVKQPQSIIMPPQYELHLKSRTCATYPLPSIGKHSNIVVSRWPRKRGRLATKTAFSSRTYPENACLIDKCRKIPNFL